MRMDRSQGGRRPTCCHDVDEQALADVIFQYGEERFSRRIARGDRAARRERAGR